MSEIPPFTITPHMLHLVEAIGEALGQRAMCSPAELLMLRRVNRIRTLRGSLAIEGNTLSEEDIQTILEGKTVVAPPREVQEVRNAIKAYDAFEDWNPCDVKDLLAAHRVLMEGLMDAPGEFRRTGTGVMGEGERVIHVAPPAARVPTLITDLLGWLASTDAHPLIASPSFTTSSSSFTPSQMAMAEWEGCGKPACLLAGNHSLPTCQWRA